jgi:phage baseplate assembly protein W
MANVIGGQQLNAKPEPTILEYHTRTNIMAIEPLYRDLRASFEKHPVNNDLLLLTDENAVKNSIKNLIFTGNYERYRQPSLGAGIPQDLFENITPQTEYSVQKRIEEAIKNYEPRALLNHNGYDVSIVFELVNSTQPIVLNQILRRVR